MLLYILNFSGHLEDKIAGSQVGKAWKIPIPCEAKVQIVRTIFLALAGRETCLLSVFCFCTSCFLLDSFISSYGTSWPILQLCYRWLVLYQANKVSPFTHTPNQSSCWLLSLINSLTHSCFCCSVFGFSLPSTQVQPMEESYEEVVIKLIQQEGTCLDFQQLPCWTVMEDMPRM